MLSRSFVIYAANVLPSAMHRKAHSFPQRISAAAVVRTDSDAYRRAAQELTLLSTDEFSRRLHRFSRTNFDPAQTDMVHAHVTELLARRLSDVNAKCVREYAHLAHVARLHDMCLAVYFARARLDAPADDKNNKNNNKNNNSSSSSSNKDRDRDDDGSQVGFGVADFMVDSAYALSRPADLFRLASFSRRHLRQALLPAREAMSAFSLLRAFWRCVCLAARRESSAAERSEASEAAVRIYDEHVAAIWPNAAQGLSAQDAVQATRRFVQYASCGDEGEMLFFNFCLRRGLLRRPRDMAKPNSSNVFDKNSRYTSTSSNEVENNDNSNKTNTDRGGEDDDDDDEEQLFYASLIATCRAGQHVDVALRYFDDISAFLGHERVSCEDLLRPHTNAIEKAAKGAPPLPAVSDGREKSLKSLSEYLVFQLLNVLQAAKANDKIVYTARAMRRDGARLSIGVWSIVLIAAGEARAADLALAAYAQAREALADGNGRSEERRGCEYLLQTALHALSKCQVPLFEEEYLSPCREERLMHCTDEFYYCALLQYAHNSTDPAAGAADVLRAMDERGVELTTRIVSRLMKIYLRVESPLLLELYKRATQRLGLFQPSWLDELLLWADRRRYALSREERRFIVEEVRRVHGAGEAGDLGGLRTQYALLRYDAEHNPCEAFAATGRPPASEPTMMDSRAHFLLKRPYCVGPRAPGAGALAVVGDPERKRRFARSALLTGEGAAAATADEVRAEEFRVYMGDILVGLQLSNNYAE